MDKYLYGGRLTGQEYAEVKKYERRVIKEMSSAMTRASDRLIEDFMFGPKLEFPKNYDVVTTSCETLDAFRYGVHHLMHERERFNWIIGLDGV